MEIVLDLEANGLYDLVTRIHVVCVRDINTNELLSFRKPEDFKKFVWKCKPSLVVFHNGIGYDLPVLRKVWGIPYSVGKQDSFGLRETQFVDTFHISQFLNPDRVGGHSLANLAKLAGSFKQEYTGGFEEWTPEMQEYCEQDTEASVQVYKYLMKEMESKYELATN